MEVVSLSSTNYIGLTSTYTYDPVLKVNQNIYYTEDGLEIPLVEAFNKLNDNTINNFSNLFLTRKQPLSSAVGLVDLQPVVDEGFSTYLATNALKGINSASRFLCVVEQPSVEVNTVSCAMTGINALLDERYMFDIEFITDRLCKISHENDNIKRYMTVDYAGQIWFTKDKNLDYLGDLSPQIFYYIYDRDSDYIVFLKNVNDIIKYVVYTTALTPDSLTLGDPLTASDIPYTSKAILKCTPRSEAPNTTKILDPWTSYNRNLKTNSQDINPARSYSTIPSNLLINNEFYTVTGSEMQVNLLSLKNTNTPENAQTRGNAFQRNRSPLFYETEVELRDYKKLFTGSNQKYGNDNISTGYEAYTTDIVLKKDKITYFHMPQIFYPYTQININDSGLTEAGAIAGDHPLKSDKIFKKLGSFKYTSPFGQVRDEATGNFLCSWLSGNWDPNAKPVWMDRYYNPSQISFFSALTANPIQAINYITVSDCLFAEIADILGKVEVFDKPSDMIFEPGAYYAYHHYGPSDVEKYISSLNPFIVQKNFNKYSTLIDTPVTRNNSALEEYDFDGTKYAMTDSLSSIQNSGEFTLSFWAKADDWNQPFGDQIIGNYVNDGFGIFNQNVTTPTLYVNTVTGAYILNSDLRLLKTLVYNKEISAIIKLDNITNYYILFKDGDVKKYNCTDTELRNVVVPELLRYTSHDYDNRTIFALCSGDTNNSRRVMSIAIPSVAVSDYTGEMFDSPSLTMRCAIDNTDPKWSSGRSIFQRFDEANTIDTYDGKLFFTPGKFTRRTGETIFYLKDDKTIVRWDEISRATSLPVTTAFCSSSQIEDFNIDYDNNLWILANDNTFLKYTTDRQFILSGTTTNTSFKNFKIGFIADFINGSYEKRVLLTQKGVIPVESNPWISTKYNIVNNDDASLTPISAFITQNYETLEADTFVPLSATGYLLNVLDDSGRFINSSSFLAVTGVSVDPTNSDFMRKIVGVQYPSSNLNVKATMVNIFDPNQTETVNISYSLTGLDQGYHHFAVRVDTYNGFITMFIDGQRTDITNFVPRKYQFNKFKERPFLIGTSNFINSIPLFKFLKKNAGVSAGLKIKDFYLYNKALKDTDIAILARENMKIHDIRLSVPCGRRNYIEEIERYFKATVPGTKSTFYNIIIKNSEITDLSLRNEIEKRIISQTKQLAPVYSKLNKIKWIN
jgi:hypothetical protein